MLALDTASWNVQLFLALHGTAASPKVVIALAVILAKWPVYVAGVLALWECWRYRDKQGIIEIMAAGAIGRGIEMLISTFAYQSRPFVVGYGPALISHVADNSMPSSHVLACLVLAFVVALRGRVKGASVILVLAVATAWARVYVGVHWPADMVASLIVALVAVASATALYALWIGLYLRYKHIFRKGSSAN